MILKKIKYKCYIYNFSSNINEIPSMKYLVYREISSITKSATTAAFNVKINDVENKIHNIIN